MRSKFSVSRGKAALLSKWLTETGTVNGSAQQQLPHCVWSSVRTLSKEWQSSERFWLCCLLNQTIHLIYLTWQSYYIYSFSIRNSCCDHCDSFFSQQCAMFRLVYFQKTFQYFLPKKSVVLVGSCKFEFTVAGRAVGQYHNTMTFFVLFKKVFLIGSKWGRGTMSLVLIHSTTA